MMNLNALPEDMGELLHEALDGLKPASEPQETAEPSASRSEDSLTALCEELLSEQRRLQEEVRALKAELNGAAQRAAGLQRELEDVRSFYFKSFLQEETPAAPKGNHRLFGAGIAALAAPLIFGIGSLLSFGMQFIVGSWSVAGSILLACMACVILGLLLLLLSKGGTPLLQTLQDWMTADDWPEGPKEKFLGKEEDP